MTHPADDLSRLTQAEREQLRQRTARLEETWRDGTPTDLATLLPPPGSSARMVFLSELVRRDLELRYQQHQPLFLEAYCKRFPELGTPSTLSASLVYAEYRARERQGDRPDLESYRARFPAQFAELARLVSGGARATDRPPSAPPPTSAYETRVVPPSMLAPGMGSSVLSFAGGYTLLQSIGRGQFGEVFRGLAPGGVDVAIKVVNCPRDDIAGQYEREALERIKAVRHPFLLQTQAFEVQHDRLYIVMELAEESLYDWFKRCRKEGLPGIPPEELVPYLREAADGLDHLQKQNILHRDVKPANLLRLGGHAKVADFGLAKAFEAKMAQATFCGTPQYMPPEVFKGMLSVHSDQYSLAVTYAELRLGRSPYSGTNPFELGKQHMEAAPDLDGLPDVEKRVVLKALDKDPDRRYPSCRAFAGALAEALAPAAAKPPRRTQWSVLLLALVVGLSLGGAAVLFSLYNSSGGDGEPREPWLPPGFERAEGADVVKGPGGQYLSKRLTYRLEGAAPLEFLLIERSKVKDPPTFYILRDKVSGEQFRAALKTPRMQELLKEFRAKYPGTVRDKVATAEGRLPAAGVTVNEAHCFAHSLSEHCWLPRAEQWDKAGGRFDGADGPFKPGWKKGGIALGELRPVGTSPDDESLFGCRDMAGNGREFTRDLAEPLDRTVPFHDPNVTATVTLRGTYIVRDEPFTFEELRMRSEAAEYNQPRDDIGFRVVVELPVDR